MSRKYGVGCALSRAEHDRIRNLANRNGLMVSEIVRAGLREQVRKLEERERKGERDGREEEQEA